MTTRINPAPVASIALRGFVPEHWPTALAAIERYGQDHPDGPIGLAGSRSYTYPLDSRTLRLYVYRAKTGETVAVCSAVSKRR